MILKNILLKRMSSFRSEIMSELRKQFLFVVRILSTCNQSESDLKITFSGNFLAPREDCNSMNKCLLFLFYFEFLAVFLILSYPRGQCKDAPFSHMVRGSQSVSIAEKIEKNCEFYVKFS